MNNPSNFQKASKIAAHPMFVKSNVVVSRGKTMGYLKYRALRPLLKAYYSLFCLIHPNSPWTTPASIIIFKRLLNKEMTALEFGSGRSTLFLAKRTKHLVSVEHHEKWYKLVKLNLKKFKIDNVDYRFVPKNELFKGDYQPQSRPTSFSTYDIGRHFVFRPEFHNYYELVRGFPDQHFDFILIDGRARVECLINSIDKLKPNGMLVLDNSNRERYQPVVGLLADWPKVQTTMGLSDTTIWFRPES